MIPTRETKGNCQVQCADEAVVVSKQEPMKAGNSGEEKTLVTGCRVILAIVSQKLMMDAKGGRNLKVCWSLDGPKMKALKER